METAKRCWEAAKSLAAPGGCPAPDSGGKAPGSGARGVFQGQAFPVSGRQPEMLQSGADSGGERRVAEPRGRPLSGPSRARHSLLLLAAGRVWPGGSRDTAKAALL